MAGSVSMLASLAGLPFRYVARRLHSAPVRGASILRVQGQARWLPMQPALAKRALAVTCSLYDETT